MTAPVGTVANRFTGIREFSQVTNTYGGYLQSAGVAYNLTLPFFPDKFEWYNFTKFGTNTNNIQGVWFRDFPAGDSLIIARGVTTLTSTLETTNGITNASTAGGFYDEHLVISGFTTATPAVVTTTANHNLSNDDRVVITKVIGTMASQVNNQTYVVRVLSATTFAIYDTFGVPVTVLGAYTSSGQVTKIGPALGNPNEPAVPSFPHDGIVDYPPTYILTLGTAIMGADNDVLYFQATKFNNYVNIGDVA
jgi:hypothetical protein